MQRPYGKLSRPDDTSSTNEVVNTALDVPAARDGSQMAGSHAYHEGEEILKEYMKESEFQWAPRNQGNRNGRSPRRIVPVENHTIALVVKMDRWFDGAFRREEDQQTLLNGPIYRQVQPVHPSLDYEYASVEELALFDGAYEDEDVGAESDLNNLETT
ncbi:hypothetical protein Tco_1316659 [Tanacetum coccineum]